MKTSYRDPGLIKIEEEDRVLAKRIADSEKGIVNFGRL